MHRAIQLGRHKAILFSPHRAIGNGIYGRHKSGSHPRSSYQLIRGSGSPAVKKNFGEGVAGCGVKKLVPLKFKFGKR